MVAAFTAVQKSSTTDGGAGEVAARWVKRIPVTPVPGFSPQIDVVVASPETGAPIRLTTYRGLVDVSVDTNKGPTLTQGPVQWWVPDSLPYRREDLTLGSAAACTVAPVGLTPIVAEVRALIDTVAASFEDDPGGEGVARLVVTVGLQTTNLLESFTVRRGYEVTAVVPHH